MGATARPRTVNVADNGDARIDRHIDDIGQARKQRPHMPQHIIESLVRAQIADQVLAADKSRVGLFMNDVHNVIAGSVPFDQTVPTCISDLDL